MAICQLNVCVKCGKQFINKPCLCHSGNNVWVVHCSDKEYHRILRMEEMASEIAKSEDFKRLKDNKEE